MFTLAHMGLRQLTHNRSLYNEVNDAREVPENTPSFFFFFKKKGVKSVQWERAESYY